MVKETEFDLQNFLPYLLNQAAEASSLAFRELYKDRYGLLRTEWRVLFHLGLYGEMTAVEIGRRARMHKTKISRAVHRLADRRFITRRRDKQDRRVEHLALTAQGRNVYQDLVAVAQEYDEALCAQLSEQELKLLKKVLGRLAQAPTV